MPYSCDCRNSQGVFLSGRNLTGSKRLKVYQGCTPQVWVLSRHPGRLDGDTHLVLTHKMPWTGVHEPLVSSYMLNPDFNVVLLRASRVVEGTVNTFTIMCQHWWYWPSGTCWLLALQLFPHLILGKPWQWIWYHIHGWSYQPCNEIHIMLAGPSVLCKFYLQTYLTMYLLVPLLSPTAESLSRKFLSYLLFGTCGFQDIPKEH